MFSITEAAELMKVSRGTIRRWEAEGLLKSYRKTPRSRRYFEEQDIIDLMKNRVHRETAKSKLVYEEDQRSYGVKKVYVRKRIKKIPMERRTDL